LKAFTRRGTCDLLMLIGSVQARELASKLPWLLSHAGNARRAKVRDSASSRVVSTSKDLLPSYFFHLPTTTLNLNNSTEVLHSTSISTEQYHEKSGADGRVQLYCLVDPQAQSGMCSMHSCCNNGVGEAAQRKQQAHIFSPALAEYVCVTCRLSKASWWVGMTALTTRNEIVHIV
jgi:hypothetical protein